MKRIIISVGIFLILYNTAIIFAQNAYPGYDTRYDILLGGIQIEITKAAWYGPSYSKGNCSLAFPVYFIENGQGRQGFITAGHCIETANGGDYVDQPRKGSWFWENYIGRGIRSSYPHGGGNTDLDAALIRLERRAFEAFIFENGIYFGNPDINRKVGITHYITPTKDMENRTILHKSGRTTGVTYGIVLRIDAKVRYYYESVTIYPALLISRCSDPSKPTTCFYNEPISQRGDSGGVWYFRYIIYAERGINLYHYGAQVIGIHSGTHPDYVNIVAVATWAVKVSEKWPDLRISYVTCGPPSSSSCW